MRPAEAQGDKATRHHTVPGAHLKLRALERQVAFGSLYVLVHEFRCMLRHPERAGREMKGKQTWWFFESPVILGASLSPRLSSNSALLPQSNSTAIQDGCMH